MRKLIPLMLVSLLYPVAGFSLGLGEIRLHSALNQPLSAEIDLLSVGAEDEGSVNVALANSEVFAKFGVDRSAALLLVSFEVSKRPDGSFYIKASSKQPIREPYLDFLLEVNWKSGRALREYTILLDPPELQSDAPMMVQPPAQTAMAEEPATAVEPTAATDDLAGAPAEGETPATAAAEEAPKAQETAEADIAKPDQAAGAESGKPAEAVAAGETAVAAGVATEAAPEEKKPEPLAEAESAAPAPRAAEPAPAGPPARSGVITYGPVRKDETLWNIASKVRPDRSVTVPQVMAALVRENPYAFYGKNANRMKAGHVLRLDPAQLAQISREEAAREIAMQGREWHDYKQRAAAQAPTRKPANVPEVERGAGVAAARKEEPRLKLVTPPAATPSAKGKLAAPGTGAADADALRKELLLAIETTEAQKQENEDLRKRLTELEGQLTNMQRLITLKDNDLAALQRQAAQAGSGKAPAKPGVTQPPSVAVAQSAKPETKPAPAAVPPATAQTPAVAQPPAAAQTPAGAPEAKPATAPATAPAATATPAPGAPAATASGPAGTPAAADKGAAPVAGAPKPAAPPARKPQLPPPPPPVESSGMFSNPLVLGAIGFFVLLLGGLAFLIIKRRRSGSSFQESILMGGSPSMLKQKAAEGGPHKEETSFFSDFAVSGMGDIHAEDSEVDPLTEADVYMAYQRYQQAEELLRDAMKTHDRPELHVKLLEVYHATRDKAAFETEVSKVNAMLGGTGPLWDKVTALGHDLLPENPLFAKAPVKPVASEPAHSDARLDNEVLDIGLDLDALAEEMEGGGSQSGGDFNLDLGVDFSDLDTGKSAAAKPAPAPAPAEIAPAAAPVAAAPAPAKKEEASLEFDLGDLNDLSLHLDEQPAAPGAKAAAPASVAEPESIDLGGIELGDLDLSSMGGPEQSGAGLGGMETGGELDLSGLDLGGTQEEKAPAGAGLGDFDLGEIESLQVDAMPVQENDEALFANLDEAGTKLDLARAYMEMGDPDGARSILDEVAKEGNATQKQQAQELLKQIA